MARRAALALVANIESLDYRFAECRALGHSWRHRGRVGIDDSEPEYARPFGASTGMVGMISYCAECKGTRVKWVTRSGEVVNRYYMADGYSRAGEDIKPTARQWRATYVASVFEEFTHTA